MLPSRPPTSRSSSRTSRQVEDTTDDRTLHQAGRSSSNLTAQASAQTIRQASRPNSRPSSRASSTSSPKLLKKKSRAPQRMSSSTVEAIPESPSQLPARFTNIVRQPTTQHSNVSSPLHETPSNSSGSSESPKRSDEMQHSPYGSTPSLPLKSRTITAAGAALASQIMSRPSSGSHTPTARSSLLGPPEMSQNDSTLSLTRQQTPRTVRDLGSDYTRYFNPFASRNSSQQDLTTALPRYNSATHLMAGPGVSSADLQNRLSNPFKDTNRLSNPFDSRHNTAPGTPLQKQNSADKEKMTAVTSLPFGAAAAPVIMRTGTPNFIRDADPEKAGFFPYMDDRLGAPEYSFPLYSDQKEDDDDMHMPQWDDDIRLKARFRDHFTREQVVSTVGLFFVILGLLCIFVALPVISTTGLSIIDYAYQTPLDQFPSGDPVVTWATVNNKTYPLMSNMRSTLIDPDTPSSAKTKQGINGDTYTLVFSDEFNQKNRTFYPGDDPYWFGFDGWYGATQDLEWYDPDAINTGDGTLQLQLDAFASHNLAYRSGMLNSWNQLCFKGGIFEVSMSLPGPAGVHGLWPGAWTMGNLGRPGYLATTDGMWPYTYNGCDTGITPNQSSPDGISNLPGQRLPSCSCAGEDHPTPGTGRGAPEIDIAEVSGDWGGLGLAVATQSFQVAPFDIYYYPNYDFMETPNYNLSYVNTYTGGPYQQAVSTTTMLNNAWYDGKEYQQYSFEYVPGTDQNAYIAWVIGGEEMMKFDARAVGPNGNIGQRLVSEEPMSMILNLGISHSWVDINFAELVFPTVMRFDYVRWYQKEGSEMVTCDPPGYETTEYIANHPAAYNNPNYTHWEAAGYSWPQNTLMNQCKA